MKHSRLHRDAQGPHARLSPPQVVAQNAQIGQLMAVLGASTPLCYDNHGGGGGGGGVGDDDDGVASDDDDWHSDDDDRRLLF